MNSYEYESDSTREAIVASQNAASSLEPVPADMNSAASIAPSVQVSGLDFLNDTSYAENIEIISTYKSIIVDMMNKAERDTIIDCVQNGDMARLVEYVNEGRISTQTLIEYAKEYMIDIMNSGQANTYNNGFAVIGGEGARYGNVNSALKAMGFSDEFINGLSSEYCSNLINNDLMYTKEGAVTMATSFIGLLSMFDLKLGYQHTEFDRSYSGFYFGTGLDGAGSLGAIDCCNFTDWISRCVGIDIYAYSSSGKYMYALDGITPSSEILAGIDSEYYTKAEGGDYLSNSQHIMMIVGNDGNGYFFAENGNYAEINYMTYEQLNAKGYKVTNTDALYRNTASPSNQEYVWLNSDGSLATGYSNSGKQNKSQVFALPAWFINQANINLTPEEQKKLLEQYLKRNQNPTFTGVDLSTGASGVDVSSGDGVSGGFRVTQEVIDYCTGGETQGPQAIETWYPLPVEHVVENMKTKYGYTDLVYSIRGDGVRVLSGTAPDGTKFENLVMVAADVRDITNPNGTFERGEIVETKMGTGIVVDYCEEAVRKRKNNQGVHFDIAAAWHEPLYSAQIYDENGKPRVLAPNTTIFSSNDAGNVGVSDLDYNVPSGGNNSSSLDGNVGDIPSYIAPSGDGLTGGDVSTPNISVMPETESPSVTVSNILPDNKFSEYMPALTSGRLKTMEISYNKVNYEIVDITSDVYTKYISDLLKKGYVLSSDGSYVNGQYRIITSISNGIMSIKLSLIS